MAHDHHELLSERSRRSTSSVIRDLLEVAGRPGVLSLAGGLPAAELLPVARVRTAVDSVLSADAGTAGNPAALALQYGPTEGVAELRDVVARREGWTPAEVIITTGSQQAIDLIARVLIDPGDTVVVEAPSYLGSLQVFRNHGARLVAVRGDSQGLRTDDLEALLEGGLRPKLVSVVPDFANPTGATLSPERRRHLVGLAERFGFLILEDNPYGELRWTGERPDALGTMTDLAVTIGSASKILAPGLRIGWLRGPAWLTVAVATAKQVADLHTSSLDQLVVADVLGDDAFMCAHIEQVRSVYRERSSALVDSVERWLGGKLEVSRPEGGMFAWGRLLDGRSSDDLLPRAISAGVAFVPGDAFSIDGSAADSMRLCFSTLSPERLDEAVQRLAGCLAEADSEGLAEIQ